MAGYKRSFFLRNGIMSVVILMLVLVSVVNATDVKIGYDGTDTYFTIPTSATKTESGSMYFDTATNRLKVYDGGWVDIYADGTGAGGNVFDQDLNTTDDAVFNSITGDNTYNITEIWNSNGNNWSASADNFRSAVYDLNNSGGGVVYVPKGTYTFNAPVQISESEISVIGLHKDVNFVKNSDMSNALILVNGSGTGDMRFRFYIENIDFSNTGGEVGRDVDGVFINFTYVAQVEVINCRFRFNNAGGLLFRTVWNSKVDKCYFQQCGNGTGGNANSSIVFDSADGGTSTCTTPWVTRNVFEGGGYACIEDPNGYCTRARILDNWGETESNTPTDYFIYFVDTDSFISGNTYVGNSSAYVTGVYVNGLRAVVLGNNIQGCNIGIWSDNAESIINDNQLSWCGYGIQVWQDSVVDGNLILHCGNTSGERGISVGKENIITNNIIKQGYNDLNQIYVFAENNLIDSNQCHGNSSVAYGIYVVNAGDHNNSIVGNHFLGTFGTAEILDNGVDTILAYNKGFDNSSYNYIPCWDSNPYSSPSDGACWFNSTTGELGIYDGSGWKWFSPNN